MICNTYFQLIISLQLKFTLFNRDKITIIITDKTPNTKSPAHKLEELHVVDKVLYRETKAYCGKRYAWRDKFQDVYDIVFGDSRFLDITDELYDEVIYFNYDLFAMVLFAALYKKNKRIMCSRFEEGILSYNSKMPRYFKYEVGELLRRILLKKSLLEKTERMYCCNPALYEGTLKTVEIPKIKLDGPIGGILMHLFNLKKENLNYENNFMYFSSVYDFEGGESINEIQVVRHVRNVVGNDNLVVKVHPRDTRDVYQKEGFNIDRNSAIPWEAIQLNTDCSEITFITATSCSVLSVNMLLDPMPKTVFVYPCCKLGGNEFAVNTAKSVEKLLLNPDFKKAAKAVHVVHSLDELHTVLRQGKK